MALKRQDLITRQATLDPSAYHVCSQHFYPDDFVQDGERRKLRVDAKPNPSELPTPPGHQATRKRKPPKDRTKCAGNETAGNSRLKTDGHSRLDTTPPTEATTPSHSQQVEDHAYSRNVWKIMKNVNVKENHLKGVIRKVRYERKCLRQALKRRDKRLTSLA